MEVSFAILLKQQIKSETSHFFYKRDISYETRMGLAVIFSALTNLGTITLNKTNRQYMHEIQTNQPTSSQCVGNEDIVACHYFV
jgi:hypothetical protein